VVLGIIGWSLLPDVVAVQIGFDGQVSNTMPKVFAILLPIAISVIGSIICLKENQTKSKGVII